jgi:uncharacterized protein
VKTVLFCLTFLLPISANAFAASSGDEKVNSAVTLVLTLCVGGGSTVTIHSNDQNQLQIKTGSDGVTLERHEAQGLVDGLTNSMSAVQADQANRVRACVQPWIGKIMDSLLHPENAVSEPRAQAYVLPASATSLLSPAYRTNYVSEASDFGKIPTIGLNPNVNDYTPNYINGGSVITTGELERAMASGTRFALIDVLTEQHGMLPGARSLPGAGMIDYQNDRAKQSWFVGQLLSITGGSYDYPVVLYCLGVSCWESFNAATRAIVGGFKNVYWYRGGINAWFAPRNAAPSNPVVSARVVAPDWCPRAQKQVERLICGNATLAGLDARLNDAYQASKNSLPWAAQQQLVRDQRGWLQRRDYCESDPNVMACVEHAYRSRLSQLASG